MPDALEIKSIARTIYGFDAQEIASLEQHSFDWRGIYRIRDSSGDAWVMRLLRISGAAEALAQTASLVAWLAGQGLLVPQVRATLEGQLVGAVDGWAIVVLAYVEGRVMVPQSAAFGSLARALGQLHALKASTSHSFAQSRSHPDTVALVAQQLEAYGHRLPAAFRTLASDLHASMRALERHSWGELRITHGDCWYLNAVETGAGDVVLIDWDLAGVGAPLLDLGYLLLTSHFDLAAPLAVAPDEAKIAAMMREYQRHRRLAQAERGQLLHALRFLPAFQLGDVLAGDAPPDERGFLLLLEKLQARYEATAAIAEIGARYWRE